VWSWKYNTHSKVEVRLLIYLFYNGKHTYCHKKFEETHSHLSPEQSFLIHVNETNTDVTGAGTSELVP
jgi:hypothetical protein